MLIRQPPSTSKYILLRSSGGSWQKGNPLLFGCAVVVEAAFDDAFDAAVEAFMNERAD